MTTTDWYFARASGVVSLVLLTVVLALGVLTRSGRPALGLPRFAVAAVHRSASLTAVGFLLLHIVLLVRDPFAHVHLLDAVVPFRAGYRPLWVGLGAVAFDLVVALVASSLLRHRLGLRTWRALHWTAYACWPFALLHALNSGTDTHAAWMRLTVIGCVTLAVGAVGWRVLDERFLGPRRVARARPPRQLAGLR